MKRLLVAWVALIVLMLASLGSAYLSLGAGSLAAGLVIALVKAGIVAAVFMRLGQASGVARIAAALGLATWLLLAALSGIDEATRPREPAPVQPPRQLSKGFNDRADSSWPTPSFGRHDLPHSSPAPPPRGGSSMFDHSLQPPSVREAPACLTSRPCGRHVIREFDSGEHAVWRGVPAAGRRVIHHAALPRAM